MSDLHRIFHESGVSRARRTRETLQYQQALEQAVDPTGKVIRTALPANTPLVFDWAPSDTSRKATARAGTLVMLRAYASTAPSTGDAVITLTMVTEASGTETLATVRIPDDAQFSNPDTLTGIPYPVPAGAWLGATVTTANGASGISISATMEVR